MSYRSLLFCPDEKTARVVTQVLTDVDFRVEPCHEPFTAVKKLMAEHFDAIVVDCENEQNAALLFKSAHNSGANQTSLAVAVVEGQSGVAKAFRIGANLVLTKPINVEQSKGTLRVARGLLRKTDTSRPAPSVFPQPATTTPKVSELQPSSPSLGPAKPVSLPMPQRSSAPHMPTSSMSSFDLEDDSGPAPDPTEAALLESMPDPVSGLSRGGTVVSSPEAAKQYPWQPIAKPMAEPMASALQRAAEAAGKSEFGAADANKPATQVGGSNSFANIPSSASVGQGAAVAPAFDKSIAGEPGLAAREVEPPIFTSFGEKTEADTESAGGSKKLLVAAVILVVVGIGGYVMWPRVGSRTFPSIAQKPTTPAQAQSSELALPTAPEEPTPNGQGNQSTVVQTPDITLSTAAKPSAETKSVKTSKAASIAPDKVVSSLTPPEPLLVKNEAPRAPQVAAPPAEPDEPPTPAVLGSQSNADNGTISGIVNAPATNVPQPAPQSLKVSQGVAQGLLMKRVQPVYPLRAQQAHVQGAVELSATIGKDGSISNLKVISGDPMLTQAAMDAVKQWKYRPYLLDGQPVEIQTQITMNFKLP
jgi:TonB family protein